MEIFNYCIYSRGLQIPVRAVSPSEILLNLEILPTQPAFAISKSIWLESDCLWGGGFKLLIHLAMQMGQSSG